MPKNLRYLTYFDSEEIEINHVLFVYVLHGRSEIPDREKIRKRVHGRWWGWKPFKDLASF